MGQGRLAIVYFADSAEYETVYKDETGKYRKKTIPYPIVHLRGFLVSPHMRKWKLKTAPIQN